MPAPGVPEEALTATGHVIGWQYYSDEHEMAYEVVGRATVWDLAPEKAVRLRWANGNETVSTDPPGPDRVLAPSPLVA